MKRGKDDEKIMEPMFPRLHVNDTEKGGPRAPPRNKMALYEQFSIPSQRSLSQGGDHQMNTMSSPLRLHRSTLPAEESYSAYSNSSPPSARLDKKKKLDEDDFTVPVFVEAETGQDHSKYPIGMDRGKLFSSSPTYSDQNSSDREPKRARSQLHNSRCRNDVSNESEGGVENGMSSSPSRDSCPEELGRPNNSTFDCLNHEDETHGSLHIGNGDRGDDASETSMVDSIPVFDISPDDVVGVIGQKHFWKARRAIVNQQRVFAVQVFELHRLMKVQKSFAGSLQLLVEDDSYSGKPLKVSVAKKLPLELIIEPSPDAAMHKDDSDKRNQRMECSAENAVGKTSIPSVQNVSRPSNCRPQSTPTDDAKTSPPWCFHQPTGQQWLIPVMSPSEGLIYKPYNPGHGFAGPLCSGYGLPGSNPMMGNFRNPAYDFPSSYQHYQPPVVSRGYFPPYGMPFLSPVNSGSAIEQAANHFTGLGSRSQTNQLSGGGANFSTQQRQRSCTVPTQKNNDTVISNAVKPHAATKECKLQGSTVSSHATEARNSLPQLHDTDQPTRVIKVVPHNAVSATESVARIFQCIQQERKQQESD